VIARTSAEPTSRSQASWSAAACARETLLITSKRSPSPARVTSV
jgi:hypothetical protein